MINGLPLPRAMRWLAINSPEVTNLEMCSGRHCRIFAAVFAV
jgi:hypothetical protein